MGNKYKVTTESLTIDGKEYKKGDVVLLQHQIANTYLLKGWVETVREKTKIDAEAKAETK